MITNIKFFSTLRLSLKLKSLEIDIEIPISMRKLLSLACRNAGIDFTDELLEDKKIKKGTLLLLNGRNVIHLQGLDTMIPPGSTVSFFPPSGGG